MEVQVLDVRVARVAKAVDDQRRDGDEGPGARRDLLVVGELHRELALEDVEEVGVLAVDVEAGAVAARTEARPGGVELVAVGEDEDGAVGRVADHLAAAGRDDDRLGHQPGVSSNGSSMKCELDGSIR